MTKKKPTPGHITSTASHAHQAGERRCLDILRQLSAYIDDELAENICTELRRHVGACPNCEEFINSLRDTVTLCRHHQTPPLTSQDRARLRHNILQAWKLQAPK
jgi:anti-sigma factor RsiW